MPNDNTKILGKILARVLKASRPNLAMIPLVNADFSLELAQKGDTINVPISMPMTATDVSPSNTPGPNPTDVVIPTTPIVLDKHKHIAFGLTDKEISEIEANKHFLPPQTEEAMIGLVTQISADIWGQYKKVFTFAGTAGTTPFGSAIDVANNLFRKLNEKKCPYTGRHLVLNFAGEENAKNLASFKDASQAGGTDVIREGQIGKKLGFDWWGDHQVPTHTSTVLTAGACTVNGAHAVNAGSIDNGRTGTVSIAKATNTTPLVAGDLITFANDTNQYVVLADVTLAVGNTTVSIAPALQTAKNGGEAVTLVATHVANLAFARQAFALAVRPMSDASVFKGGNEIVQMQDPVSRMIARMEVSRQNKRTVWDFDVLYGVGCPRPEFAARLLG